MCSEICVEVCSISCSSVGGTASAAPLGGVGGASGGERSRRSVRAPNQTQSSKSERTIAQIFTRALCTSSSTGSRTISGRKKRMRSSNLHSHILVMF